MWNDEFLADDPEKDSIAGSVGFIYTGLEGFQDVIFRGIGGWLKVDARKLANAIKNRDPSTNRPKSRFPKHKSNPETQTPENPKRLHPKPLNPKPTIKTPNRSACLSAHAKLLGCPGTRAVLSQEAASARMALPFPTSRPKP